MMFLLPAFFLCASGIVVPLAIHLWNKKTGRTILFGSVAFIRQAKSSRLKSIKLNQIGLLILRSAIILLLTLLLAKPVWEVITDAHKRWVLIDSEIMTSSDFERVKPGIDSLVGKGYVLKLLQKGFPDVDEVDSVGEPVSNFWNLLYQADELVPDGSKNYVFAMNKAGRFRGNKLKLANDFELNLLTVQAPRYWIEEAHAGRNTLWITVGQSRDSATLFNRYMLPLKELTSSAMLPDEGFGGLIVSEQSDTYSLRLGKSKELFTVPKQLSIKKVLIYYDANSKSELPYFKAAFQAIEEYSGMVTEVEEVPVSEDKLKKDGDLICWLSEKTFDTSIIKNLKNTVILIEGNVSQSKEGIGNLYGKDFSERIYTLTPGVKGEPVWKDGFGHTILAKEKKGKVIVYTFAGKFAPGYTHLVHSQEFPYFLYGALASRIDSTDESVNESKMIDFTQAQLPKTTQIKTTITNTTQSLSLIFWIAILILFMTERIITATTK